MPHAAAEAEKKLKYPQNLRFRNCFIRPAVQAEIRKKERGGSVKGVDSSVRTPREEEEEGDREKLQKEDQGSSSSSSSSSSILPAVQVTMKERAKRAGGSGKKKVFEREFTDLATIRNISSTVVDSLRIAQLTKSEREQSGVYTVL